MREHYYYNVTVFTDKFLSSISVWGNNYENVRKENDDGNNFEIDRSKIFSIWKTNSRCRKT